MADTDTAPPGVIEKIDKFVESRLLSSVIKDLLLSYFSYEDGKLKWNGSLEELKIFIEDSIGLQVVIAHGGNTKTFTCETNDSDQQFSVTWCCKKQCSLVFQDNDVATNLKNKLILIASKKPNETVVRDCRMPNGLDNQSLSLPTCAA